MKNSTWFKSTLTGVSFIMLINPALSIAAEFNLSGPVGDNIDIDFPPATFQLNAQGGGNITDLNVVVHVCNDDRPYVPYANTAAWGDMNVTLSKDDVTVTLWAPGNPGETTDLFVVFDDDSSEGVTLNDILDQAGPEPALTTAPQSFVSCESSTVDAGNVAASYSANGTLADFNGIPLAGTWTLTFSDNVVPTEGDDLINWQIFGTTDSKKVTVCNKNNRELSVSQNAVKALVAKGATLGPC